MKSSSLFASQRATSSGRARRSWVLLIAVMVAFVVTYSSMKVLHGMVESYPEDDSSSMKSLVDGSMREIEVSKLGSVESVQERLVGVEETNIHATFDTHLTREEDIEGNDDVMGLEGNDNIDADTSQVEGDADVEWEEEEDQVEIEGEEYTETIKGKEDLEDEEQEGELEGELEEEQEEVEIRREEYKEKIKGKEDLVDEEEEEDSDDIHKIEDSEEAEEEEMDEEYALVDAKMKSSSTPTLHESPTSVYAKENGFQVKKHTDYWGDALVWGNENLVDSEDECCKSCIEYKPKSSKDAPCNVWVYCGNKELCDSNYKHCWLKYLAHPEGRSPANEGPMVGWTTGIKMKAKKSAGPASQSENKDRSYHIVVSAQGLATHWQARIHYYWYKKIKKQCEAAGRCDMGGFTRLLHSGKADDLMEEIPSFVAEELPKEHPHHGYIVLNRPYAFLQWVQKAKIKEKYVLMGEPDHIWLKPLPNMMIGESPAAFPFFYIEPTKAENIKITEKFVGKLETLEQQAQLYPIGSSPTMLSLKDMKKIVPIWYNVSLQVHEDEEAVKVWGWIQEMYAFTMSMYLAGVKECALYPEWMGQPPWDTDLQKYYLLHYTYGMDYTLDGTFTPGKYGEWRFDKRSYLEKPLPRKLGPPPKGMQNDLVRHLIKAFNEATDAIPDWDSYEKTGKVKKIWDGVIKDK